MADIVSSRSRLTPLIFAGVGVLNTLLDFTIYTLLVSGGGSIVLSNIASTSIALIFSFIMNARYTFKAKKWTVATFAAYLSVTLFGLWVLQTAAIYLISRHLDIIPGGLWNLFGGFEDKVRTLAPKVIATAITLVWNYLWYSRVIFKDQPKSKQVVAALDEL